MASDPMKVKQPENGSIFHTVEWKLMLSACVMSTLLLVYLAFEYARDVGGANVLVGVLLSHMLGGRAAGVLLCINGGFHPLFTLIYNFYVEAIIVLVVYPAFILIMRDGVEAKIFHIAARKAEEAAQSQMNTIKRYGLAGLFLFVMFPFAMTGPVTGAVIGYLLAYKERTTLFIVFSGTLSALVGYVLFGEWLMEIYQRYSAYEDTIQWVVFALIAVFIVYHLKTIIGWFREIENPDEETPSKADPPA